MRSLSFYEWDEELAKIRVPVLDGYVIIDVRVTRALLKLLRTATSEMK